MNEVELVAEVDRISVAAQGWLRLGHAGYHAILREDDVTEREIEIMNVELRRRFADRNVSALRGRVSFARALGGSSIKVGQVTGVAWIELGPDGNPA